ncbi:M55 family metallopeptidase [Pseudemcibacter aquimaris]|uniref:M55 family metallopeptidase n=1 Tax=Pseudemcibacter aquimaris TaxID=2857064 RepID=UPI0020110ECB|nr:M55 family metallopeptidase [Pseudemcibacter aquimaris]MCC3860467.1 M55 family metallopeptidase [Pseudemcibacter aquimaris]WDU59292.1 M55 family metallopeptidase [Pseudemcibacter aquimaris]
MKKTIIAAICALTASTAMAQDDDKLKIYISVDLEGIAGAVTGEQLGPGGFEYNRFREFATAEALAAVEGAFEAGADEVLVSDSHGNGQNLLIEKFPENVKVIRSWPRKLGMMQGIEEGGFDGAIFIGYHSSTNYMSGVRAHTKSSADLTGLWLNGKVAGESYFNAAIAGHYGVPIIMISGDDAAVKEAQETIGNGLEGAVVKWNYSFHSAKNLHPTAAQKLIKEKTIAAINRIDDFEPMKIEGPITMDISFKNYRVSEMLDWLPQMERIDSHTIRYVGPNMPEVSAISTVITSYNINLAP